MNYIAFDYGQKRIGVAIATDNTPALRLNYVSNSINTFKIIQALLLSRDIKKIIVGIPKAFDGELTTQGKYCYNFVEHLKLMSNIPVIMVEESMTTKMALNNLSFLGYNQEQIKNLKDSESARIMLQEYLDNI